MDHRSISADTHKELNKDRPSDLDDKIAMQGDFPAIDPFLDKPGSTHLLSQNLLDLTRTNSEFMDLAKGRVWSSLVQDIASYAESDASRSGELAEGSRANQRLSSDPLNGQVLGDRSIGQIARKSQSRFPPSVVLGVFAAIVLCAIGLPSIYNYTVRDLSAPAGLSQPTRIVSSPNGQQVNYHFPDGSSVLLAPGTTIQYSSNFGSNNRDVTLNGEALFTVTQQAGNPFTVKTGKGDVRVLGTTFSVRNLKDDDEVTVIVAEGKVSVLSEVLMSGNSAVIGKDRSVTVNRSIDIASTLSWTTGRLEFKRAQFREVANELERWLGVTITVTDSAAYDKRITGSFKLSEPNEILESIGSLLKLQMNKVGNNVVYSF